MGNDGITEICQGCGLTRSWPLNTAYIRMPCPTCGEVGAHVELRASEEVAVAVDSVQATGMLPPKRPGDPSRRGRGRKVLDYFAGRTTGRDGREVHKERLVDRPGNRYREYVRDLETGEVLREEPEGPLDQHESRTTPSRNSRA